MQFGYLKCPYEVLEQNIDPAITEGSSVFIKGKLARKLEVPLVPKFTFFTSAKIIYLEGITPIFVEVNQRTFNIDYANLEYKENIEKICNLIIE